MPEPSSFEYAVLRVVPQVEREEFINVGVILFCLAARFLDARIRLDAARLEAIAPELDRAMIQQHLNLIPRICAGEADSGALAELTQAERFRWLASPSSTVIQPSPVHTGLCDDPQAALDDLFQKLVT